MHTIVVSIQHSEKIELDDLRNEIKEKVIKEVIPSKYIDEQTVIHINPCGLFIIGGPQVSKKQCKHPLFPIELYEYITGFFCDCLLYTLEILLKFNAY